MQLLDLIAILMNDLHRPLRELIIRDIQLIQRMHLLITDLLRDIVVVHVDEHRL